MTKWTGKSVKTIMLYKSQPNVQCPVTSILGVAAAYWLTSSELQYCQRIVKDFTSKLLQNIICHFCFWFTSVLRSFSFQCFLSFCSLIEITLLSTHWFIVACFCSCLQMQLLKQQQCMRNKSSRILMDPRFLSHIYTAWLAYCKNSNIIRTIFTNNRGPIAGLRIIHVN